MRFYSIIFLFLLLSSCNKGPYQTALLGKNIKNWDPAKSGDYSHLTLFSQTCGRLTSIEEDTINIVGDLAKSWDISSDLKAYTFTLKTNRKFSNKNSFTSRDIIFTFKRLGTLGKRPVSYKSNILKIEANGDEQVIFTLKKKNPRFLYLLSHPIFCTLSESKPFLSNESNTFPNSNGPYKIAHSTGNRLILRVNDFFDKKVREKEIVVNFLSHTRAIEAFKKGELHDLSFYLVSQEELRELKKGSKVIRSKIYWSWVLMLNPKKPCFRKKTQRLSFIQSIKAEEFISDWHLEINSGRSVIPKGMPGHLENVSIGEGLTPNSRFNCSRKMKAALIKGMPSQKRIENALGKQIKRITGREAIVNSIKMGDWSNSIKMADFDIYVFGLDPNSTDPLSYYRYFTTGSDVDLDENTLGHKNDEFNTLFWELYSTPYRNRKKDDYKKIHNAFYRAGFGLILGYPTFDFLYHKKVKKAHINPLGMHMNKWWKIGR